jgi:hypothetical protein
MKIAEIFGWFILGSIVLGGTVIMVLTITFGLAWMESGDICYTDDRQTFVCRDPVITRWYHWVIGVSSGVALTLLLWFGRKIPSGGDS